MQRLPVSDWRGEDYDRISAPHAVMGSPALDRLELRGDERVLDAGCGSGRIADRLGALAIAYVRLNVTARKG